MSVSCGIDFGTTNSAAGVCVHDDCPKLLLIEGENVTIPSALFFDTKTNSVYFGRTAAEMYLMGEDGRYMRSLKRILGTELMGYHTQVGKQVLKFDKIISLFLTNIKNKLDIQAKTNVEHVVMGRPVHFRTNDIEGDKRAQNELEAIAKSIGFKHIEFQYEPIAAAFAHEEKLTSEKLACIIDIGGGTSDFTVIRLGPKLKYKTDRKNDILANSGIMIGGNDFDKRFSISSFMPILGRKTTYGPKLLTVPSSIYFELSEWSKINGAYASKNIAEAEEILSMSHSPGIYRRLLEVLYNNLGHKLLNTVENAKMSLTQQNHLEIQLDFLNDCPSVSLCKPMFEDAIMKDVHQIDVTLNECLTTAHIKPEQIELTILTGGSTQIELIQKQVTKKFPNAQIADTDKLSSVGLGLAYDAKRRFG